MNTNEKENAAAINLIKAHGGFNSVRQKTRFEAVSETMLTKTVTVVEILDAGPDSDEPRFTVSATRQSDGKKSYSGHGATLEEAISKVEWGHLT